MVPDFARFNTSSALISSTTSYQFQFARGLIEGRTTFESWEMDRDSECCCTDLWSVLAGWLASMLKGLFQEEQPLYRYSRLSQAAEAVADAPSPCPEPCWLLASHQMPQRGAFRCQAVLLHQIGGRPQFATSDPVSIDWRWFLQKYSRTLRWKTTRTHRIRGVIYSGFWSN